MILSLLCKKRVGNSCIKNSEADQRSKLFIFVPYVRYANWFVYFVCLIWSQPHSRKRASCTMSVVRIACSGLIISLLQVVNRLDASWLSRLFIHKLNASCFNNLQQAWKYQISSSLTFTNLIQLDEANSLDASLSSICIKTVKSTTCICGISGCASGLCWSRQTNIFCMTFFTSFIHLSVLHLHWSFLFHIFFLHVVTSSGLLRF